MLIPLATSPSLMVLKCHLNAVASKLVSSLDLSLGLQISYPTDYLPSPLDCLTGISRETKPSVRSPAAEAELRRPQPLGRGLISVAPGDGPA